MTKAIRYAALFMLAATLMAAMDETADVKSKLAQENDPVKRARLQMRLAEMHLESAAQFYQDGYAEKGLGNLKDMLEFVEQAAEGLFKTGRDPRKKPKGFKETEIKLRELSRRTEDLRLSLPVDERTAADEVVERIKEIQEDLLHGIMRVRERKS